MNRKWLAPAIAGAVVLFTVAVYGSLPERIPTHFNFRGRADGWSSRPVGAFLLPGIMIGTWLLLHVLRRVDPRRDNYERFDDTFWLLVNGIVFFLGLLHVAILGETLGWPIHFPTALVLIVGLGFIAVGNYLPRIRSNWWMGIRTPWTLESERVWRETHRLGGRTFVAAGVATMASLLLPNGVQGYVMFGSIIAAAIVPLVYSYFVWRRERETA
jgi:uncharacterized membrane protein